MERLKKWILFFGIVLIVSLVIYILPWRYRIDKTIQGVQYRLGDEEYSEDVTITIKGVYKRYLFKDDKFEGTLAISLYDLTSELPLFPITFSDGIGYVLYGGNIKGRPVHEPLGFISCTPDFDKLLLSVSEPIIGSKRSGSSWTSENGLLICAPAENREQALNILSLLSRKSKWLNSTEWK